MTENGTVFYLFFNVLSRGQIYCPLCCSFTFMSAVFGVIRSGAAAGVCLNAA